MSSPEEHFPHNYRDARNAFIQACEAADLGVTSRLNGAVKGADEKALFLDTTIVGARDAKKALLLISATHGVEGYFGSAVQTGLLRDGIVAPKGTKIVMLHALNPFGFSWDRRVNEDNADINRNFVDFKNPPKNPAYDALADAIILPGITPEEMKRANAKLHAYSETHGAFALQAAISAGQYNRPDGIYYGGAKESWSAKALKNVFCEELKDVKILTVLDFHTGLGEHGAAELIIEDSPQSAAYKRARAMWGERVLSSESGESVSPPLHGTVDQAVVEWSKNNFELTYAALEVGTKPSNEVFRALRRDNWLCLNAKPSDPAWAAVKRELRDAFYPDTSEWKRRVWDHAMAAVRGALAAFA